MGGFGSGRQGGKRCTNDMLALDVRSIHRAGRLTPGSRFNWQWSSNGKETAAAIQLQVEIDSVTLIYRNHRHHATGNEWETMHYKVSLDWTHCGFGGQRVWWRCPAVGCGRRVAVLHGGRVFACRQCNDLAYRSQRETDDDRASRRANKIKRRLSWPAGVLHGTGGKPKGMHWRTYWRLFGQHNLHVSAALAGMVAKMNLIEDRLDRLR